MSVSPSVKRVNFEERKETSVHIFRPYERSIILVFRREEWLVEFPILCENLAETDQSLQKTPISHQYSLVSLQQ